MFFICYFSNIIFHMNNNFFSWILSYYAISSRSITIGNTYPLSGWNNLNKESSQLQRGLKNRHIQLIAMGGAIGTGLFLGSAQVIQSAGPSIILGYAIGGLIAFLIMRQLGEMIVHEPVAGSFSHFAFKYWGKFPGFLAGWNYWILYILVAMTELTAVAKYINFI